MVSLVRKKLRLLDVFSWRFLVNYVMVLLVTCWIPLVQNRAALVDAEGNVLEEEVTSVRLYRSYYIAGQNLIHPKARTETEAAKGNTIERNLLAVLMHLFLCFAISYCVWFAVMRRRNTVEERLEAESAAAASEETDP